ncbi:uncharacterized protein [Rutidosis leptorrhynchoides]|uniref:uncharacterized protein n=1 Tax=Rutidosis leptorrhynchoides TaxID=125765 RepID=UPI003A9948B8
MWAEKKLGHFMRSLPRDIFKACGLSNKGKLVRPSGQFAAEREPLLGLATSDTSNKEELCYKDVIRSRSKEDNVTVEHHYRVEEFFAAIDSQLQELNSRFNESVTEILRLSVALDPKKPFNKYDICNLAKKKNYPLDFTEQENIQMKHELQHYELDVPNHPQLKNARTIAELCKGLQETGKNEIYPLLDRLIRLIFTLPVSTSTSESGFSVMKIVKTSLRCSMGDDFLKSCLLLYIEKDIVDIFTTDEIIDAFASQKRRRVQLIPHKVQFL